MKFNLIFKATTIVLILLLFISGFLHLVLLLSDSESYRKWVYFQMFTHLLNIICLYLILKAKKIGIHLFIITSLTLVIVNAVFINYGNIGVHFLLFAIFWMLYGPLLYIKFCLMRPSNEA